MLESVGRDRIPKRAISATIHTGSVAFSSAATPEGTTVSAQWIEPWPIRKNKMPSVKLARHCGAVGRYPRDQHHANSAEPPTMCRKLAVSSGGMVITAYLMPRYVEPQTMWIARNDTIISRRSRFVIQG